jgi:hypothetical protein
VKVYQITFKNGLTLEFASYKVAEGYTDSFGLPKPVEISI